MPQVLKEEKYPNGSLEARESLLDDQPGQQVILKEGWYSSEVISSDPWQATDGAQQRSGQQQYKFNYVNGQKHGLQEGWYENSQRYHKENYVNGQQHGVQEYWYENGQRYHKENYVNGQEHGLQEGWYENGQQQLKWNYVNGQKHGIQEHWYQNGQLDNKKYYLNGVKFSQEAYQADIKGLAPCIQATIDFEEPNLSRVIAGYLLP